MRGPLTLERLRALWPEIVTAARLSSPMVGTLLAETEIRGVDGITVTLASPGHAEGLDHKRDVIARVFAGFVSGPVKVTVATAGAPGAPPVAEPAPPRAARLTEQTANAERLKLLRAKDPTLGAAVDALDLELLE